jgi:hypothetical protein
MGKAGCQEDNPDMLVTPKKLCRTVQFGHQLAVQRIYRRAAECNPDCVPGSFHCDVRKVFYHDTAMDTKISP